MKPGDKVFRIVKLKDCNDWYFCIYELVRSVKTITGGFVELAPVLTFYSDSNYKQHSTFAIKRDDFSYLDDWVRKWDYITTDEEKAVNVYKEKRGCLKHWSLDLFLESFG